jgi:hypothetical protein
MFDGLERLLAGILRRDISDDPREKRPAKALTSMRTVGLKSSIASTAGRMKVCTLEAD